MDATEAAANRAAPKGRGTNRPPTEAQQKSAGEAWMAQYRKVGAPMVVKELLSQGMVAEADEFMAFIDRSETREGMKHWARAAFAATIGDVDGFMDGLAAAYNAKGYYPDNMSIDRKKSGLVTDDSGRSVGMRVVFTEDDTGNTIERVYDLDNIVNLGISMLSPEAAFDAYLQQQAAGKAIRAESANRRVEMDEWIQKKLLEQQFDNSTAESIRKAAQEILKADIAGQKTTEQALEEAVALVRGAQAAGNAPAPLGEVPVLRRPTN